MAQPQNTADNLRSAQAEFVPADDSADVNANSVFRFSDEVDSAAIADQTLNYSMPLQGPGLFKKHALKPVHPNAQPFEAYNSDWFTISLLLLIGFFTWFRYFFYKIFRQLIGGFFNMTTAQQIVRDESVLLQRASLFISVVSYLLIGLFLYQLSNLFSWQMPFIQSGMFRFVLFSVLAATAYSAKMLGIRFLSVVFDQERPAGIYVFIVFLMVMMAGLILLPANILIAYAPDPIREWTLYISLGLIGCLFLYRLVRAVLIWMGTPGFNVFYLFLYLCGFEIAPLLILWKLTAA